MQCSGPCAVSEGLGWFDASHTLAGRDTCVSMDAMVPAVVSRPLHMLAVL